MIKIYQIYYDLENQQRHFLPNAIPFDNSTQCDYFFENSAIRRIYESGLVNGEGLFGIFSWQFTLKDLFYGGLSIQERIQKSGQSGVYSFSRNKHIVPIFNQAESWHKGITHASQCVLDKAGIVCQLKTLKAPVVLQNHFLATPDIYRQYVETMLIPCMEAMESDELKPLLWVDTKYNQARIEKDPLFRQRIIDACGVSYYPLHTFICERLFSVFLAINKISIKHI